MVQFYHMGKAFPNLSEEQKLWLQNRILIGVDEAGRGPLAGPVVAAAVVLLPQNSKFRNKAAGLSECNYSHASHPLCHYCASNSAIFLRCTGYSKYIKDP